MYFADLISDFDLILVKASDLQISLEIDAYYLGSLQPEQLFFCCTKTKFFIVNSPPPPSLTSADALTITAAAEFLLLS